LAAVSALLAMSPIARAEDPAGAEPKRPVCLDINRIDHTEVLNDHQILFYMNGKEIWVNNLTIPCRSLTRQDGFVWKSSVPQYCDNIESIRVIRTGEVCLLGTFSPYQKPPKAS